MFAMVIVLSMHMGLQRVLLIFHGIDLGET
jgi:hypothetical protein